MKCVDGEKPLIFGEETVVRFDFGNHGVPGRGWGSRWRKTRGEECSVHEMIVRFSAGDSMPEQQKKTCPGCGRRVVITKFTIVE